MDFYIANHKDSTYRTTFVYVVTDIAAPAQTRNTSRVLGWGALAIMANHAGGKAVNEARRSHTCSRPCTFKEKKSLIDNEKIRPTENTPRKPQQPGDRDHLETACDETRPTRSPTHARFHRSRVCGNRPRTALAISKNDECYTRTYTKTR